MKILLDTHIWVWYLTASPKLPPVLRNTLNDNVKNLWISPVSVWEAILLANKGKFGLNIDPIRWVRSCLEKAPLNEAPLNIEVAIKSRELALPHQDPADRFLAATSLVYDLPLATVDDLLLELEGLTTVPL